MTLSGEQLTFQALLSHSTSASLMEYLLQQNNFQGPLCKKKKCQVSLEGRGVKTVTKDETPPIPILGENQAKITALSCIGSKSEPTFLKEAKLAILTISC